MTLKTLNKLLLSLLGVDFFSSSFLMDSFARSITSKHATALELINTINLNNERFSSGNCIDLYV